MRVRWQRCTVSCSSHHDEGGAAMGKVAWMPQPPGVPWHSFEFWAEPLMSEDYQYGTIIHIRNIKTGMETTRTLEWRAFSLYVADTQGNSLVGLVFQAMMDTYPPEVRGER